MYYIITLRNGNKAALPIETFNDRFRRLGKLKFMGSDFKSRLEALKDFYPNAVDWTMEEGASSIIDSEK